MRAVYYEDFRGPVSVRNVADPIPEADGVVIRVQASGVCRSDWHGWMGHDSDISLPHVPGHELTGTVEAIGGNVKKWQAGDRVTLPFVCGCGVCAQCTSGNHQVCDRQFQPGFTHWGSFAEFVAVRYADVNLVRIPDQLSFVSTASLGCRFATSFRAVVDQGRLTSDQWLAVHGCGGVGLSAIMIAEAMGAAIIAVDICESRLDLARSIGATACVNAASMADVATTIKDISAGGVHVSIDALGSPATCFNSISGLRKRGKHIQVGLLSPEQCAARVPMGMIVANELEILGSHGMQAHRYPQMLGMILDGRLNPEKLIGRTISLDDAPKALVGMDGCKEAGISVIDLT